MSVINLSTYPSIKLSENNKETTLHTKKGFFVSSRINELLVPSYNNTFNSLHQHSYRHMLLLEILFHGLNISAKRIKRLRPKFFVDVHKSEIFICHQKIETNYKSRLYRRRLLFFSYDPSLLHYIKRTVQAFKLPNVYTGKGLYERNQSYHVRKGKEYRR